MPPLSPDYYPSSQPAFISWRWPAPIQDSEPCHYSDFIYRLICSERLKTSQRRHQLLFLKRPLTTIILLLSKLRIIWPCRKPKRQKKV